MVRQQLALAVAGPRHEEILAARAQLTADEFTLSLIERRVADTVLLAPSSGTILTRVLEPGAVVLPNSTVYALAVTDPVWIRSYVAETAMGKVKPGMPVTVSTDTPGGQTYTAQVGYFAHGGIHATGGRNAGTTLQPRLPCPPDRQGRRRWPAPGHAGDDLAGLTQQGGLTHGWAAGNN